MAVGKNHTAETAAVGSHEREVGNDDLDPQFEPLVPSGKGKSAIDQKELFSVTHGGAVHAEFTQPAERYDFQEVAHAEEDSMPARIRKESPGIEPGRSPALISAVCNATSTESVG